MTEPMVDLDGYGHVSEVASLEYGSADEEPTTLPYGTYESCDQPFGMVKGQKVSCSVTEKILSWVDCGEVDGCQ